MNITLKLKPFETPTHVDIDVRGAGRVELRNLDRATLDTMLTDYIDRTVFEWSKGQSAYRPKAASVVVGSGGGMPAPRAPDPLPGPMVPPAPAMPHSHGVYPLPDGYRMSTHASEPYQWYRETGYHDVSMIAANVLVKV